jgi:hypothetical protein
MPKRPPTLPTLTITPRAAREHAREDGQAHAYRREEVQRHHAVDLDGGQDRGTALRASPMAALFTRTSRAAERCPMASRATASARADVREVCHPEPRRGRVAPADAEDLFEALADVERRGRRWRPRSASSGASAAPMPEDAPVRRMREPVIDHARTL